MGAIQAEHIHLGLHQGCGTLQQVLAHAHGGTHPEAAHLVLAGVGIDDGLLDVLHRDQALQLTLGVHHQQLFNAVLLEDDPGLLEGGAHGHGDQVVLGHGLAHGDVQAGLEAEVPVGEDAHQLVAFDHGHAADAELGHEGFGIPDEGRGLDGDGVRDHARLGALHLVHFLGLALRAEVLVDDADAAQLRQGDGHAALGDRVHGRRHQGDADAQVPGDAGVQVHLIGVDL